MVARVLTRPDIDNRHCAAAEVAQRKAVAKLCEWPSSRCVSDSSRYIRSRAQYAAKWCVVVTVEPPKGTEGITGHDEASLRYLSTWLQRRVAGEGPLSAVWARRGIRLQPREH
eukprot:scaffold58601_cov30-Phaeocystis_antarctica.AAC.1